MDRALRYPRGLHDLIWNLEAKNITKQKKSSKNECRIKRGKNYQHIICPKTSIGSVPDINGAKVLREEYKGENNTEKQSK